MRKILNLMIVLLLTFLITSCKSNTLLDKSKPVTINMWHVYGEQVNSPMSQYIQEFNSTIGKEKGIIIEVTLLSNAHSIGDTLRRSYNNEPGAPDMPDLFTGHISDALILNKEDRVNWKNTFTTSELNSYDEVFINDGIIDDTLSIFPVSKSTYAFYVAGGVLDRFLRSNPDLSSDLLNTWDGFFEIAKRYYETEGKPFTAIDYLIRCMELYSLSSGDSISNLYNETGWYNSNNMIFKNAFMKFIDAILNKHIIISNLYSNTQVMSGEVASGIGSSASILYYNDVITYDDNTQEEMNLKVFKIPQANIDNPYVTQAGVGFIGHYTTPQKQEAMYEFVKWFTEINRNIEFVVSTGYMPVHNGSFNIIKDYDFEKDSYKNLYKVLEDIRESSNFVVEPSFTNYYQKVNTFNSYVKNIVSNIDEKLNKGATKESLKNEIWDFFIKLA